MSVARATVVFYVADVPKSQAFYTALFGQPPVHTSSEFALYMLNESLSLGIWQQAAVIPPLAMTQGTPGELCLYADDQLAFQALYQHCLALAVPLLQPPTAMDFATAFTIADPDGYRIRYAVTAAK